MRLAPAGLQGHQLQRKSASVILVTSLDGRLQLYVPTRLYLDRGEQPGGCESVSIARRHHKAS